MLKNRTARAFFLYTFFFLVLGGGLVCIFSIAGRSMIEGSDAVFQHYPALCYIRGYIRQIGKELLLHHRLTIPLIDYRIGQGMDVLTTLNYYGFGDPLMCISAFFPENAMVACYGLLILLRIYLCGAFFLLYCSEVKAGNYTSEVAGAIAYCFGTYTLFAGFKHPMFLNGPLYLPLLLLGVERAFRKKKYLLLSAATALCLISNFYFAYMNTIIVGCYILIRLFWMRKSSVRERLLQIIKLALAYICGMGLSAAVFLPVVYAFFNNGRISGVTSQKEIGLFYSLNYYKGILRNLIVAAPGHQVWTCLGFSALFLPAVVVLFAHRGDAEEKRWMRPLRTGLVLCGILICFPAIGKAMNGFSYVANRWFFVGAFAAALTVTYVLPGMLKLTRREAVVTAVVSVLYLCVLFLTDGIQVDLYRAAIVVCVLATLLVSLSCSTGFLKRHAPKIPFAAMLMCLAVFSSGLHICGVFLPQFGKYIYRFVSLDNVDNQYTDASTSGMALVQETEDEPFGRVDRESTSANRSLVNGLRSHSYYFSMTPSELTDFYQSLSLNGLQYSDLFRGQAGRTILDEITATRYYATTEAGQKWAPYGYSAVIHEDESRDDGAVIMENEYFLPLGFTYSSYVDRKEYEELEPEKRQQLLLQSAVLEEEAEGITKTDPDALKYSIYESDVSFHNTEDAFYADGKLVSSGQGTSLAMDFETPPESEAYLLLKGIRSDKGQNPTLQVTQDGYQERVMGLNRNYKLWFGHEYMLVNLGYSEEARTGGTLLFNEKWDATVDEIKVISYGMENYAEQAEALGENTLENIEVRDNQISGEITLDEEKLLYISVPYSKGWSAYVDGKKAKILKANLAYMALIPGKGTHTVVLRYETPCLRIGSLISLLSLSVILICFIFRKNLSKTRRTNGRGEDKEELHAEEI